MASSRSGVARVRQHDITDCGAACLRAIAASYGMAVNTARIRAMAGTDQRGTNMVGMVMAAKALGFTAKGVRADPELLAELPLPAVAHVVRPDGLHHYVVVCRVTKAAVEIMDPADGAFHERALDAFCAEWSGVLLLLLPSEEFRPGARGTPPWRRALGLVTAHRRALGEAMLGALLVTVLGLSTAIYVEQIVDRVLVDGNRNLLNLLGTGMLVVLGAQIVLEVARSLLTLRTGQRIDAALITGYYRHVTRLPQAFFDRMRTGEIVSRINDAVKIRSFINDIGVELLVHVMVIVAALSLMVVYSWRLALVTVATLPVYALVLLVTNRRNRREQRSLMERSAELESQLVETLGAAGTLKRLGAEPEAVARVESRFVPLLGDVYRASLTMVGTGAALDAVGRLATIVLLWIGAGLALDGALTPGELMSCYALLGYLSGPISSIINANRQLQEAVIAADRLFDIMDLDVESGEKGIALEPRHLGAIEFADVAFRYGSRAPVFEGLSLRIPHGRTTAIVGESGSGKSTIAALLQRLHDPESGAIRIGGHPLSDYSLESIRRVVGVVPQDVTLLSGSIIDNVALGDEVPDLERVRSLMDALGMGPVLARLPDGIDTKLGEFGAQLSGGERQRLSIARALYRDPQILVLDEATAALDPVTERTVQDVLLRFRAGGRSLIVIAHRLTTTLSADEILVLDRGHLVEQGPPAVLLKTDGMFARLWRAQHAAAVPELGPWTIPPSMPDSEVPSASQVQSAPFGD